MIITFLLTLVALILNTVFSWLPVATALPTMGGVNLDYYVSTAFGYFHFLTQIFPPLAVVADAALAYLTWRVIVLGLKMALGHRTPTAPTT